MGMYNPEGELTKHNGLIEQFESMLESTNDNEEIDELEKRLSESKSIVFALNKSFNSVSNKIDELLPNLISEFKILDDVNNKIDSLKKLDPETLKQKRKLIIQKKSASSKSISLSKQINDMIPTKHDWYELDSGYSVNKLSDYGIRVRKDGVVII